MTLSIGAAAQQRFAIVVDTESDAHCRPQLEAYAESVRKGGLDAFIAAGDWTSPEAVRDSLYRWYREQNLVGTVFIGDIPVPMVRKAQYLTSAFKMDEQRFPMRDSSVPSDRFYDDFDLRFDFVGRDSVETRLFYYDLAPDSPQEITCDIFSGRICPSGHFQDRYVELAAYLEKLVRIKREWNPLDRIVSYTGQGSFSDSMIAWKDETVTLEEQVPAAFRDIDGAKFYVFYQFPYMKDAILKECQRDDVDLVLFHCHGTPERQWIQNQPVATFDDEYYAHARLQARELVRRKVRFGSTREAAMADVMQRFGLDSTWVADTFSPEAVAADSLEDLKTGIILEDVWAARPNARMYIFDACYNGDFREEDCIASRYIFSGGNAVVGLGNTVNVLQDKASSTLLGMLASGYNVGEWHRMTAILESHVIGDPTFAFAPDRKWCFDLHHTGIRYWQKAFARARGEERSLALYQLHRLGAPGMAGLLLKEVKEAPTYMERLNALTLLQHYDLDTYREGLRAALEDPYEYTRRKAAFYLSRVGDPDDVPALVAVYLEDFNAKRIEFNIVNNSACFPDSTFLEAYDAAPKDFLYTEPAVPDSLQVPGQGTYLRKGREALVGALGLRAYAEEVLDRHGDGSRSRSAMLQVLRNNPYPQLVRRLVALVQDEEEPLAIRIQVAEALGWFTIARNRDWIVAQLEGYQPADEALRTEVAKTVGRLKVYMR